MEEAEFVGKVNRFGSEYHVYLNPEEKCIRITDENGIELKCPAQTTSNSEKILEMVPRILKSIGL
ncbi:MAG: hypothetical protein U0W24_15750 [Bacteroidales bacterium]